MNRREFLRNTALAALMATPAMRALAFASEFGLPDGTLIEPVASPRTWYVQSISHQDTILGNSEVFLSFEEGRSFKRPFRTFQKAADKAQPGDTIVISHETEIGPGDISVRGTLEAPITIRADSGCRRE